MAWIRRVVLRSGGELPRCSCGATLNTSGCCPICDYRRRS
jgi:hypothetical protein